MMEQEARQERLFRAIGGVGGDLIDAAEKRSFQPGRWRRYGPVAAALALLVGFGWLALPYFSPEELPEPPAAVTPVEPETAAPVEEPPATPDVEQEQVIIRGDVAARQELVFRDVVYYVEAQYTAQEAESSLGDLLGTVQRADDPTLPSAAVYGRRDAATREDSSGYPLPLEIFVENSEGYLYCLTYYYSDLPLMAWEEARALWQRGDLDGLTRRLVLVPELAEAYGAVTWSGEALTPEEQVAFFRVTLQMERQQGLRSEDLIRYLWKQDGGYVVPVSDIRRQLERYLDDFSWAPEELPGYSAEYDAVLFPALALCSDGQTENYTLPAVTGALDEQEQTLTLRLSTGRVYTIAFTQERMTYRQIAAREE